MQMLKQPVTQAKLDTLLASAKARFDANNRVSFTLNLTYAELVEFIKATTVVLCPLCNSVHDPKMPLLCRVIDLQYSATWRKLYHEQS